MNTKLILIALSVAALSSCSTVYKIEQTPDDVYYSPAPPRNDYVQVNNEEDRTVYNNSAEDREILRRVNNRRLRRRGYDYGYDYPYSYGYYPYVYNPYGYNYPVYVNPKMGAAPSTYKGVRKYNLGTYSIPPVTTYTIDPKTGKIKNAPATSSVTTNTTPARTFNNQQNNKGTGVGNFFRKVFSEPAISSSTNNNNNTYNNTTNTNNSSQSRSFSSSRNNSSSNSSSSGSSSSRSSGGGSNARVRTF